MFSDKFVRDKEYWDSIFNEPIEAPNIRGTHKFDTKAKRVLFDVPKRYYDYCTETKTSPFALFLSCLFIYFSRI